ncbi:MAG: 4Fe-4S binding protein [Acidobacteria bacterium]|jgi:2-oxoacid:acceptor oxidoreductase delta subunit (pyruvate/2-ketoisovalerate family)|nr:4Fe-4S binding protein [Acidobacteriota bacterium]
MREKKAKKIVFKSAEDMPLMICSTGSQTHNLTGAWRNIRPEIDLAKCIKCGICWKFCPEPSIDIVDEWPVVDYDYCKGCGICAEECPSKCIVMVEERK